MRPSSLFVPHCLHTCHRSQAFYYNNYSKVLLRCVTAFLTSSLHHSLASLSPTNADQTRSTHISHASQHASPPSNSHAYPFLNMLYLSWSFSLPFFHPPLSCHSFHQEMIRYTSLHSHINQHIIHRRSIHHSTMGCLGRFLNMLIPNSNSRSIHIPINLSPPAFLRYDAIPPFHIRRFGVSSHKCIQNSQHNLVDLQTSKYTYS